MAIKILIVLLLALFGFAWFVNLRATRQETIVEATHPPKGQFISVKGTRVHAQILGSGPDLVLIHGSSGNTNDMTFALAPLLAQDFRVIVFDRPGLGYSDRIGSNGASLSQQAEVLMLAARELGADKPLVLGQSYGGGVALAWAVHHPGTIAALIPVSAVSNPWETPLDPYYRVTSSVLGSALVVPMITAFVQKTSIETALQGVFAPQSIPEGYMDYIGPYLSLRRTSARENAAQRANLLDEITTLYPLYETIKIPVEIVHGSADDTVNMGLHADNLVRQIPNAVLTRLEGIGHMPHHVATRDVIAAIHRAAQRAGLR